MSVEDSSSGASRRLEAFHPMGTARIGPEPSRGVTDADGAIIGTLVRKMLSLGGAFRVFDPEGNEFALVKGEWKGWNFKFIVDGEEIGSVTKKWAGLGKELFTSADNYIISITGETEPGDCELLLAAGIAIDTVFKEKD